MGGQEQESSRVEQREKEHSRRAQKGITAREQSRRAEQERRLWSSFKLSLTKNPQLLNNISWVY